MALLSTLVNDTLIDAPGAPYPLVLRELRLALEKFCKASNFWRITLAPILIMDGETGVTFPGAEGGVDVDFDLALSLPADTSLCKIMAATYNGFPLKPSSITLMDANNSSWRTSVSGIPYFIERVNGCTLAPEPSGGYNFVPTISIKPSHTATEIDDSILVDHRQTIIYGALATLLASPGRAWSNPPLGAYFLTQFQMGVQEATVDALQDNQPKKRVTTYGGIR